MIKLFNTLTRKKEEFKPLKKGEAKIYGCGPTVYWYQHIGNMRRYIFEDILIRTLKYNDYKIKHIINITDVGHLTSDADEGEDKMAKALKRENLPLNENSMKKIADKYTKVFKEDLEKLNITKPNKWPKATEHIKEMIETIKKIQEKGYAYETSVGLIYDTSKFKDYVKLAKLNLKELEQGARVKKDPERKTPSDFALWITNQPNHIMQWDSPWGKGFPGWHIECSAMSSKYLGKQFDIHTGGEEHIPVHHTNEIAQSEAAFGKKPWVKYWLHLKWLLVKGEKMSKSKGNLYTISELEEKGYNPLAFRYLCLLTSYRKPLNFTLENLDAAQNAYDKIKNKIIKLRSQKHKGQKDLKMYEEKFLEAIDDDLNTPKALSVFNNLLNDFDIDPKEKLKLLEKFDKVLGLDIKNMKEEKIKPTKEVQKLLEQREKAREKEKWEASDILRDEIRKLGYNVKDTKQGQKLEKI